MLGFQKKVHNLGEFLGTQLFGDFVGLSCSVILREWKGSLGLACEWEWLQNIAETLPLYGESVLENWDRFRFEYTTSRSGQGLKPAESLAWARVDDQGIRLAQTDVNLKVFVTDVIIKRYANHAGNTSKTLSRHRWEWEASAWIQIRKIIMSKHST